MSNVYFKALDSGTAATDVCRFSRELLDEIIRREEIALEQKIPLKVHFGEKGNKSFIRAEHFLGIIDFLRKHNIESCYMETSAMYGGQRHNRELHTKTAIDHGFTQLPIVIADGERGEAFTEIDISRKHFQTCKIGKAFMDFNQLIVISHFKGHFLAGFGGAIKQLSMGHAAKGGKLAMHMGIKPRIKNRRCKQCELCMPRCNENAITIGPRSFIDHEKCVGCGACVSICPHKAVSIFSPKGVLNALTQGRKFREKLIEYAYAAQLGKKNIYISFATNITRGCDCEPRRMKPVMDDIGILASSDPVAIDQACLDLARERGRRFKGGEQLHYAEKIGLGSTTYTLIPI